MSRNGVKVHSLNYKKCFRFDVTHHQINSFIFNKDGVKLVKTIIFLFYRRQTRQNYSHEDRMSLHQKKKLLAII